VQKILFVRKFKKPSGGQFKVRDYFAHCRHHPELAPYLYFTPDSKWQSGGFWREVPEDRIVKEANLEKYDFIFLAGRDWEYVPEIPRDLRIINYIQHVKHADPGDRRFQYLRRPAWRICVSKEVAAAIAPFATGEISVIANGIPLELFAAAPKHENSVFILANKNPALGAKLFEALQPRNRRVSLNVDFIAREDLARRMKTCDIFVALPNRTEGFYLPALEAMASGCAVVCSDAVGNRSFCMHEKTCLMPAFDDAEDYLQMIEKLLAPSALKETIRRRGREIAPTFSLESERKNFYVLLEKFLKAQAAGLSPCVQTSD